MQDFGLKSLNISKKNNYNSNRAMAGVFINYCRNSNSLTKIKPFDQFLSFIILKAIHLKYYQI